MKKTRNRKAIEFVLFLAVVTHDMKIGTFLSVFTFLSAVTHSPQNCATFQSCNKQMVRRQRVRLGVVMMIDSIRIVLLKIESKLTFLDCVPFCQNILPQLSTHTKSMYRNQKYYV